MNKVLFDLSQKCRTWLVRHPGSDGREKIAAYLKQLLIDQDAINNRMKAGHDVSRLTKRLNTLIAQHSN